MARRTTLSVPLDAQLEETSSNEEMSISPMSMAFTPTGDLITPTLPRWAKNAVITSRGWVLERTNNRGEKWFELLRGVRARKQA